MINMSEANENTTPVMDTNATAVRELTETVQRVQADFENYRKRTQNEFNTHYLRGKASAFKEILSFVDTLDSALSQVKDEHKKDIEQLRTQLMQTLAQNGVKPLSTKGKMFDPFTSECVMQGNDPTQKEDIVLDEFQRGYTFHDDVLRPAKVKVNKVSENDAQEKTIGGNKQ